MHWRQAAKARFAGRIALGGTVVAGTLALVTLAWVIVVRHSQGAKPASYAAGVALTACLVIAGVVVARLLERQKRAARALEESRDKSEQLLRERQAALEELRASEERFRDVAELSSDWFWEQDASLRFTFMSNELRSKMHLRPESTLGKLRWELPIVGVSEAQWRAHRALLERREPFRDLVYEMINESGERRWFSISGKPLFDGRGEFRGYRGTGHDITGRVHAEEALRGAEERNRSLLAAAADGVWIHSNGRIEYVNDALVNMLGYDRAGEIVGHDVYEMFPAEEREALRARVMYTTTKGLATPVTQAVMLRRDGSRIQVETTAASYWQTGRPWSIAIIRDITERKQAEALLRLAASVFDSAAEGIMITGRDDKVISVNPAFTEITGYSAHEVIGKSPWMFQSSEHPRTFYTRMWSSIAETGRWNGEIRDRRKNGEICWLLLSIKAIRNERGEVIQHCAIFADITQRKAAEAALMQLNAELEDRIAQRTAELESFSYSVSHDLRAPLRAITGFSAIVLDKNEAILDAESVDCLRRIWAGAERMALLIDDLLNLSRVSRQEMHRCDIDLSDLAGKVIGALKQSDSGRDVRAVVAAGMTANADPGLARILLENLLGNAWKFTSRTGEARIEVGRCEGSAEAVYFVRDNGAGFDMQYVHKLFQAFQRLHTDSDFEGSGIGLSIVQRIVARHGGKAWAEGRKGEGATFYFSFG